MAPAANSLGFLVTQSQQGRVFVAKWLTTVPMCTHLSDKAKDEKQDF